MQLLGMLIMVLEVAGVSMGLALTGVALLAVGAGLLLAGLFRVGAFIAPFTSHYPLDN